MAASMLQLAGLTADPAAGQSQREDLLTLLRRRYGEWAAPDLLTLAIHHLFPRRIAVVSSFGAEAAALLALIADVDPATPVIFLDTGKHFPETLAYREALTAALGLSDVRVVAPDPADLTAQDPGGELHRSAADRCCHIRKVLPLQRALRGLDAWITGRKRYQGGDRTALPTIELADGRFKLNPLASWDRARLQQLLANARLPTHPLVARGYPSIGCAPCTEPVAVGEDARAGRWRGQAKTECGIHDRPG